MRRAGAASGAARRGPAARPACCSGRARRRARSRARQRAATGCRRRRREDGACDARLPRRHLPSQFLAPCCSALHYSFSAHFSTLPPLSPLSLLCNLPLSRAARIRPAPAAPSRSIAPCCWLVPAASSSQPAGLCGCPSSLPNNTNSSLPVKQASASLAGLAASGGTPPASPQLAAIPPLPLRQLRLLSGGRTRFAAAFGSWRSLKQWQQCWSRMRACGRDTQSVCSRARASRLAARRHEPSCRHEAPFGACSSSATAPAQPASTRSRTRARRPRRRLSKCHRRQAPGRARRRRRPPLQAQGRLPAWPQMPPAL